MPTYEYLCDSCQSNLEIVQKISEDSLKTCPSCGKDTLRRVISATAFHLKGSGWYKTDYASGSGSSSSHTSTSANSGSDTGTATTNTSSSDVGTSVSPKTVEKNTSQSAGTDTVSKVTSPKSTDA